MRLGSAFRRSQRCRTCRPAVAKAGVLGEYREQRLTTSGPLPSAITIPSMSRVLRLRAAVSTLSAPTRPTRSPIAVVSRIRAAAPSTRQLPDRAARTASRGLCHARRNSASKPRCVQRAHTQAERSRATTARLLHRRRSAKHGGRQARCRGRARQHWHECSAAVSDGFAQARAGLSLGPRPGIGQDQRRRLDLLDGCGGVREARFDDWKSACLAQRLDQIGRRPLGHDHHRTQRCHDDVQPAEGNECPHVRQSPLMPG